MAHAHIVKDSDNHFIIDPITRQLSSNSKKTILIKTDHNSEQFTFELPRYVEGHDMSTCNKVEVHFLNINSKTRQTNPGVYNVVDFAVDAEDNTKVLGTWLVSREATKYPGSLNFVIRFACMSADDVEDYSWNTAIYTGISITDGICNTETITEDYVDIFRQWLDALELAAGSSDVYAITDDGVFINLCEKIDGIDTHVSELETQIDGYGEQLTGYEEQLTGYEEQVTTFDTRVTAVEEDVSTFKESINTEITEFKESVNTDNTAFKEKVTSTVNGLKKQVESAESFSNLTKGTLNSTSIGTEGTFYIRVDTLQSTAGTTTITHNIGINLILTKCDAEDTYTQHFIGYIDDTFGIGMTTTCIELSSDGKLSVSTGVIELNSDKTHLVYTKLSDLSGKFYYKKLS